MALRDDLKKAIDAVVEQYTIFDGPPTVLIADNVLEAVWATLEDVVGSAQEALFNQLTAARTELAASRRREEALRETVAQLSEKPEAEEPSDE